MDTGELHCEKAFDTILHQILIPAVNRQALKAEWLGRPGLGNILK